MISIKSRSSSCLKRFLIKILIYINFKKVGQSNNDVIHYNVDNKDLLDKTKIAKTFIFKDVVRILKQCKHLFEAINFKSADIVLVISISLKIIFWSVIWYLSLTKYNISFTVRIRYEIFCPKHLIQKWPLYSCITL